MCAFCRTIDLGHLPWAMVDFEVYENHITSLQNICNLPATLKYFIIRERHITAKTIRIGTLPDSKFTIDFRECGFEACECENPKDVSRVCLGKLGS